MPFHVPVRDRWQQAKKKSQLNLHELVRRHPPGSVGEAVCGGAARLLERAVIVHHVLQIRPELFQAKVQMEGSPKNVGATLEE